MAENDVDPLKWYDRGYAAGYGARGEQAAETHATAEAEWLTVERLDAALGKAWGHILRMTDYNESRAEVAAAIIAALAAPPTEPRE